MLDVYQFDTFSQTVSKRRYILIREKRTFFRRKKYYEILEIISDPVNVGTRTSQFRSHRAYRKEVLSEEDMIAHKLKGRFKDAEVFWV